MNDSARARPCRPSRPIQGSMVIIALVWLQAAVPAIGADDLLRVLPDGRLPHDRRLGPLKDLNGYFPFDVPKTRGSWEDRAAQLRRRILVATGLWPMPDKTPLNATIHGRTERDGFTVEKVYFESLPDHFVTGLLFRPAGNAGQRPAVLCPHGHGGRLQDYGQDGVRRLIVAGAERFEGSGRYPKLARCAHLARMGCVSFIFDMVGYADSVQISRALAHGYSKTRPEMDGKDSWGFFSTQAELRLQSIMGLQTWNSIRALDFLCSLPDVDARRVAVTGGSGGGTQTILLCAIDSRPIAAFPQGMVSTAMQGGCTCENCCLLRVGTGNVELAALFAPKPQAMTAANDWTKDMMTKGYPELRRLYDLHGAEGNVSCRSMLHFPHNYNYVTRAFMYSWFNRHIRLGLTEPIVEDDFRPLTADEWTVWDEHDHPRPASGEGYERALTKHLDLASHRQLSALVPGDAQTWAKYRQIVGQAYSTIIGRDLPGADEIQRQKVEKLDRGDYWQFKDLLSLTRCDEQLPVVSWFPQQNRWNGQVVIWIDGHGKGRLVDSDGQAVGEIKRLLEQGIAVLSADLLYQGEFLQDGEPPTKTRVVDNPREFAGYTFGYNHTLFAQRVHDIMTLISFVRHDQHHPRQVDLVGVNGAGPWVAAARARVGASVDRAAIDTGGFRFAQLSSYRDPNFLPGAVKYGDLPALLALSAPGRLWLAGEGGGIPEVVRAAYQSADRSDHVQSYAGRRPDVARAIVQWLIRG